MWLCSSVPGNACKAIEPEFTTFKDNYECTVYGYEYSRDLISNFSREFVNEYQAYTRFMCLEQETELKQET